jgi:hypothetical protein
MDIKKHYPHLFEFSNLKTSKIDVKATEKLIKKLKAKREKNKHKLHLVDIWNNSKNN